MGFEQSAMSPEGELAHQGLNKMVCDLVGDGQVLAIDFVGGPYLTYEQRERFEYRLQRVERKLANPLRGVFDSLNDMRDVAAGSFRDARFGLVKWLKGDMTSIELLQFEVRRQGADFVDHLQGSWLEPSEGNRAFLQGRLNNMDMSVLISDHMVNDDTVVVGDRRFGGIAHRTYDATSSANAYKGSDSQFREDVDKKGTALLVEFRQVREVSEDLYRKFVSGDEFVPLLRENISGLMGSSFVGAKCTLRGTNWHIGSESGVIRVFSHKFGDEGLVELLHSPMESVKRMDVLMRATV